MAKIAKMSKKEVRIYLKSLNDMSMVEYEINRRDRALTLAKNTIAQQGNTITQQGNTIAALQNQIEEYQRRYGNLNGSPTLN